MRERLREQAQDSVCQGKPRGLPVVPVLVCFKEERCQRGGGSDGETRVASLEAACPTFGAVSGTVWLP